MRPNPPGPPSRRDFLKLAGLLPVGLGAAGLLRRALEPERRNILVIVLDALSARNMSLYGYARPTTPNLARLAERAIVYHNHYAAGNYTTPGTASLLTGTYPWTHRAVRLNAGVHPAQVQHSIFEQFPGHHRIAYSHNNVVNIFFKQFRRAIDEWVPRSELFLTSDGLVDSLFRNDDDIASIAWSRTVKKGAEGTAYSLFFSSLYEKLRRESYKRQGLAELEKLFPRGLPNMNADNTFMLEQAVDWLGERLPELPKPFLGYFHFLPPHYPYNTRADFFGRLKADGFRPLDKPEDPFRAASTLDSAAAGDTPASLLEDRTRYDEFILYADAEMGRLFEALEAAGILEDTWVVLTSDHGELFERGIQGHNTPVLYEPLVHIPLLIFEPGQKARTDVHMPTSAVDLLPTLLHVSGGQAPPWAEGSVLPPFAIEEVPRSVYALQADRTQAGGPIETASAMAVHGNHKLLYYFGYPELQSTHERIELYDLEADPEEMHNLFSTNRQTGEEMLSDLKLKISEADAPYRKS